VARNVVVHKKILGLCPSYTKKAVISGVTGHRGGFRFLGGDRQTCLLAGVEKGGDDQFLGDDKFSKHGNPNNNVRAAERYSKN